MIARREEREADVVHRTCQWLREENHHRRILQLYWTNEEFRKYLFELLTMEEYWIVALLARAATDILAP
jgi:hypothetical protein